MGLASATPLHHVLSPGWDLVRTFSVLPPAKGLAGSWGGSVIPAHGHRGQFLVFILQFGLSLATSMSVSRGNFHSVTVSDVQVSGQAGWAVTRKCLHTRHCTQIIVL